MEAVRNTADASISGWPAIDLRGFVRHDYAGTANSGAGNPAYADIGPYEYDTPPGAPTITVGAGDHMLGVTWTDRGDDGDVGTAAEYALSIGPTGSPGSPGTEECVLKDLDCNTYFDVVLTIREQDNGQTAQSNTVHIKPNCSGYELQCQPGEGLVYVGSEEESVGGELAAEDFPLYLGPEYPNPARGAGTIELSIPRALDGAEVDMGIFDVSGRRVSTLLHGVAKPGRTLHVIRFLSDGGKPLAGGVYFLRLQIGPEVMRRTLVLAR